MQAPKWVDKSLDNKLTKDMQTKVHLQKLSEITNSRENVISESRQIFKQLRKAQDVK